MTRASIASGRPPIGGSRASPPPPARPISSAASRPRGGLRDRSPLTSFRPHPLEHALPGTESAPSGAAPAPARRGRRSRPPWPAPAAGGRGGRRSRPRSSTRCSPSSSWARGCCPTARCRARTGCGAPRRGRRPSPTGSGRSAPTTSWPTPSPCSSPSSSTRGGCCPDVPLWNAHVMGGRPFLANAQSAVFSPFTVPVYVLGLW